MPQTHDCVPLIVGGHSFFSSLGNDPVPSEADQRRIVEVCLDSGIAWFDTTHQPERTALGKVLRDLGRRDEATIIAWNFLKTLAPGDNLDRPTAYQPHHIEMILEQLQTSHLECLVVHPLDEGTPETVATQIDVAVSWMKKGYVGRLGVWAPEEDAAEKYGADNPFNFMVRPYNVTTPEAPGAFAASKALGWETFACSPFVRGWQLDKMAERASSSEDIHPDKLRARIADHLLRNSLFALNVDRLITAMRRSEWIASNIGSVKKGPLSEDERAWLMRWVSS